MNAKLVGAAAAFGLAAFSTAAFGATATLTPIADGDVRTWGGDVVDTTSTVIEVVQSGGLVNNGVMVFDLSSIADGATISSVSLAITLNRFVSNTGGNPGAVDIFAYGGDAAVTIDDYSGGTQVFDGTTPTGGGGGDVRSFSQGNMALFESLLIGDLLTIRIETDSFASIQFAALEHPSLDAAALTVDYTVGADVPLPAALPMLAVGLAGLGLLRRRG